MARLPEVGGDSGQWGQLLNDYLNVAHNADGTLKSNSVGVPQIAAGDPNDGQVLSYSGSSLTWTTVSGSGTVPDATSSTKGLVQLTGDLAGTAASPTVPGLAGKEATVVAGTTSQYYRGDKSWQTLNKAAVGLGNVDNTADTDKPISTATQAALNTKAATSSLSAVATSGNYNDLSNRPTIPTISDASSSVKGIVQLTGDLGGTAASPTVPGLAGKQALITPGTTSDYYRGDKTWVTLNKYAVNLGNVDDTSDANKPISTATQVALDNKASINHNHAASAINSGTLAAARLPQATDTAIGAVELATTVEATTGTDTSLAVTPAGVKAAITALAPKVIFVDSLSNIPPGTPVDTLVIVRAL